MPGLFELATKDKRVFFNDFPLVDLLKEGDVIPISVRALPSFIGIAERTDGIEIGADSHEITFNYDDESVSKLSEDDFVFYKNKSSVVIKYQIERIARDRHLGLWSCYMRVVSLEEDAGIIDRRNDT